MRIYDLWSSSFTLLIWCSSSSSFTLFGDGMDRISQVAHIPRGHTCHGNSTKQTHLSGQVTNHTNHTKIPHHFLPRKHRIQEEGPHSKILLPRVCLWLLDLLSTATRSLTSNSAGSSWPVQWEKISTCICLKDKIKSPFKLVYLMGK